MPKNLGLPLPKNPQLDPRITPNTQPTISPTLNTTPLGGDSPKPKMTGGKSSFEPSTVKRKGVPDDSVGRVAKPKGGKGGIKGVPDDSVGRIAKPKGGKGGIKGVPDDSVGINNERDSLIAPKLTKAQLEQRNAAYLKLETPTYLDSPQKRTARDLKAVETGLKAITNGAQATALMSMAQRTPEVGARLEAILAATTALRADVRNSILQTFAMAPSGKAGSIVEHLVTSPAFQRLGVTGQTDLAAVMGKLDDRGLSYLGALVEKHPQKLADADAKGGTLLSNLANLASQPLNATLTGKTKTESLLADVLRDVVNPNRVEQGSAPTCTVTSMEFELVRENPGEFARLLAGLAGVKGKVEMRGGSELRLGAHDADRGARDGRSVAQAIFQSCAMEYANGRFSQFDPVVGRSLNSHTGAEFHGLKPQMQKAMLEHLFGIKYSTNQMGSEAEGARMLEKLRGFDSAKQLNRPVILDIDQGPINHAVTLERINGGRVYFRDPYGALKSMPDTMFAKYVMAVHLPSALAHPK